MALRYEAREVLEGPVIGALGLRRKAASGQFPAAQMKSQAFATRIFVRAWFIRAIAIVLILFPHAFHTVTILIRNLFIKLPKSVIQKIPISYAFLSHKSFRWHGRVQYQIHDRAQTAGRGHLNGGP
jgi:hypothetical protein